jgi:hypothetical protein
VEGLAGLRARVILRPAVTESAIAAYHRILEADPGAAREQSEWLLDAFRRRGVTFAGEPMSSFVRPHLVSRRDWEALQEAGGRLLALAARVARHAFHGDVARLLAFLGTPRAEARWVSLDPGPPDVVLSRLDAFLTPEGPRFIEINSDAPAGFGYSDRMAELVGELPAFQRFAHERRVSYTRSDDALVGAVASVFRDRGGRGSPVVAVVDWAEVKTRPDQEILRDAFRVRGFECFLADPREVEVVSGRLRAAGRTIDVVYRRAVLSEMVQREGEVRPFLEAYRAGAAVFVNSLRCRLSEDKAFLALLTDESFANLLGDDERAFVARAVPWTRRVEERKTRKNGKDIDLVPFLLKERRSLVLKPAHGYGGDSVHVGSETTEGGWESAVRTALTGPWVVQERVVIPEEPFPVFVDGDLHFEPFKVNANPFYVAGARAGAVTRASRSAVINVSAGGGSVPTFVVED